MKKLHTPAFRLTALAAALLAAFGPARAEEADEVTKLITPSSEVSLGLGYVDNENKRWGKFTGMTENGTYLLLDLDGVTRDEATGTWIRVQGRNLGLDDREFRFEHNRQGNWDYFLEYSQIPFNQPLTIVTRTLGIGTPIQNPAGIPVALPLNLDTDRKVFTGGFTKWLGKGFDFTVRYRNEDKEGNRRWGNQGPNFLAEPIDWTTNQLDAAFSYNGEKLQLSLGYYGTTFDNSNAAVYVPTVNPNNAVSLPPDSESHQAYLSGGYSFTQTTRGNFKVSYTKTTQNEAFFAATNNPAITNPGPLNAIGRTSLDGELETTFAQVGIFSRPIPKLTLRADAKYDDRQDNTPRLKYVNASDPGRDGFNVPMSRRTYTILGEATYQLPMGFRIIGAADYYDRHREVAPTLRQVSWREDTDETSYRVELRRSLSETINGSLSYIYSDRDGSAYLPANNNAALDVIDPIHWGDRKRDKVRLRLDWTPLEPLFLQFTADYAQDKYGGRPLGPDKGKFEFYGLDGTYVISDKWQVIGWLSRGDTKTDQATIGQAATGLPPSNAVTAAPGEIWSAHLRNTSDAIGLGVRGKPMAQLELGANLQYLEDKDEFNLFASSGPLPEITNRHVSVTVFGAYAVRSNAGLKLQYTYDRWTTDDWAWQITPFPFFTNNTFVFNESPQTVHFIGLSGYYQWR